jgi:invasion protein IalB
MHLTIRKAGLAGLAALLICLGSGCASSQSQQTPVTPYMRSQVGTPNELSPEAPPGASQVRKVGGHWTCVINGQTMVYNSATTQWTPQK